jgi:hypothetical protein
LADQIHKKFSSKQVVDLLQRYEEKEIEISYIIQILQISKRRFFEIFKKYRKDRNNFSIEYERKNTNNKIDGDLEDNIMTELGIEKCLIEDNSNPIKTYNYSYIKDLMETKYGRGGSLPRIIDEDSGIFYASHIDFNAEEL